MLFFSNSSRGKINYYWSLIEKKKKNKTRKKRSWWVHLLSPIETVWCKTAGISCGIKLACWRGFFSIDKQPKRVRAKHHQRARECVSQNYNSEGLTEARPLAGQSQPSRLCDVNSSHDVVYNMLPRDHTSTHIASGLCIIIIKWWRRWDGRERESLHNWIEALYSLGHHTKQQHHNSPLTWWSFFFLFSFLHFWCIFMNNYYTYLESNFLWKKK